MINYIRSFICSYCEPGREVNKDVRDITSESDYVPRLIQRCKEEARKLDSCGTRPQVIIVSDEGWKRLKKIVANQSGIEEDHEPMGSLFGMEIVVCLNAAAALMQYRCYQARGYSITLLGYKVELKENKI